MAEEIENKNGVPAEAPKKRRRGVSNETQAVSQLRFHEKDAAQNGLFVGHLAEVKVEYSVGSDGTAFAGMKQPRLTIHFASNHANPAEQRHVYQTLFPVASNVDTIPGGKAEWSVNNVFNWMKHILEVFYLRSGNGVRPMTEAEEDALTLPFCDYDDNNQYVAIDPEEVLNGYNFVFTNFVAIMNGTFNLAEGETPKCCYKDANGKPLTVWMKLLRHRKTKKGWINVGQNGELAFDNFLGSGAIELFKGQNIPPAILRVDLSKESITPKETKKDPDIPGQGIPAGMMGGAVMANMPMGMGGNNSAFDAAGEGDMPF